MSRRVQDREPPWKRLGMDAHGYGVPAVTAERSPMVHQVLSDRTGPNTPKVWTRSHPTQRHVEGGARQRAVR
ncbi:hypothetical protein [Streptomyces sp. NPDC001292]|uniref:hypothetical protein n=1 Tax=Streptomyces sp. NPDC001292 TaxID=3364558 RepID=UPI0036C50732